MILKNSEILALALLTALIIFSAATKNHQPPFLEKSIIEKRKLKEDSTVILIDMPPANAIDMFEYSYENK
jgi:hypothetical protein